MSRLEARSNDDIPTKAQVFNKVLFSILLYSILPSLPSPPPMFIGVIRSTTATARSNGLRRTCRRLCGRRQPSASSDPLSTANSLTPQTHKSIPRSDHILSPLPSSPLRSSPLVVFFFVMFCLIEHSWLETTGEYNGSIVNAGHILAGMITLSSSSFIYSFLFTSLHLLYFYIISFYCLFILLAFVLFL